MIDDVDIDLHDALRRRRGQIELLLERDGEHGADQHLDAPGRGPEGEVVPRQLLERGPGGGMSGNRQPVRISVRVARVASGLEAALKGMFDCLCRSQA